MNTVHTRDESTCYLAYQSSTLLSQLVERFLYEMRSSNPCPQSELLLKAMDCYIAESMNAFLIKPASLLNLSPTYQKVVSVGTATIKKTSQTLTKQLFKKATNRELQSITSFVEAMILREGHTGQDAPLTVVAINQQLRQQIEDLVDHIRAGVPSDYRDEMVCLLLSISAHFAAELMLKPVSLMPVGPVVRKMANLGIDTAVAASRKVIKQVFGNLNDEQLLQAAEYFESLVFTFDAQNTVDCNVLIRGEAHYSQPRAYG